MEVKTEVCPTCRADWHLLRHVYQTEWRKPMKSVNTWTVICANGHEHRVEGMERDPNGVETLVLRRNELVGSTMRTRRTRRPCCACGYAIDPGQAYIAGPFHLGCNR